MCENSSKGRETNIEVGEDGDIRIMKKTAFDI